MSYKKFFSATFLETAPFMDGSEIVTIRNPDHLSDDGILVLWGGEDISPRLYKHPRHPTTGPDSGRDLIEVRLANRAIELGIPIIGICRGAQLLCALAGGSLIQDVRGHSGHHFIVTSTGEQYTVNSIHHQQLYLAEMSKDDYELLAHAEAVKQLEDGTTVFSNLVGNNHQWKDGIPITVEYEPEAVWFPKIKGLAIQWHPEYMSEAAPVQKYVQTLVDQYCKKEVTNALELSVSC